MAVSAGALLASIFSVGPASATAYTGPIRDFSNMCVDDANGQHANYTHIRTWDCNDSNGQMWTYHEDNTISLMSTNKCMQVHDGLRTEGTKVDLYDCNGTGAQVWVNRPDYSLYNPQSGMCLDVPGWAVTAIQLDISHCTQAHNQAFLFYWQR